MKNWPLTPAIELCIFAVDCINKTAPSTLKKTPYKMIRTSNIRNGSINTSDVRYATKETFERWTKRSRPAFGDVILTREAPVGEVGRVTFTEEDNIFLGQRLFHYRPDSKKTDWNYFAYALKSKEVQDRIHGKSFGSTVPHIKVGDAENLLIPTPPLSEQRKIGHILSSYDDLIATNQRRIALLEEATRLIYREWFVHLRFPGHESTHISTGIPEGWKSGSAHEFINILSGGTPKTSINNYWDGDIPFFTPKDSPNCFYTTDTEKSLTSEGLNNCNSRLFPKETIFITARGTVGKTALSGRPMAMNQSCYALTPKEGIGNLFLFMAIRENISRLQKAANGGVFNAIVVDTFRHIPFLAPKPELTLAFDDKVRPLFEQVLTLIQQNRILAQARDLLLPKLMSGQIDVSNIQLPDENVVT